MSNRSRSRMRLAAAAIAAAAIAHVGAHAAESTFPTRPVRLMTGFGPGGGSDVVARIVAKKLAEFWDQPVIVDNRPGAGGVLAGEIAAKATPDGYTLLFSSSSLTIQPSTVAKLPYDPVRDFTAVTQAAAAPYLMVTHPGVPATTVAELVALAKARPGKLNCATAGAGSAIHLAAALFNTQAGVDIVLVPYRGVAGLTDMMAGNVQMSISGLPQTVPHVKSGRMRALAVTTRERAALLPDIPTMTEAGVPDYEVTSWYGVIGPARIPAPVVTKLHEGLARALRTEEVRSRLLAVGISPIGSSPDAFSRTIAAEIEKWRKVIAATRR